MGFGCQVSGHRCQVSAGRYCTGAVATAFNQQIDQLLELAITGLHQGLNLESGGV